MTAGKVLALGDRADFLLERVRRAIGGYRFHIGSEADVQRGIERILVDAEIRGSDPVIADVLGLKKSQIEGIADPNADIVTKSQVDPDHMKRLATAVLNRRGEKLKEAAVLELPEPTP